jgi:PAS domain S-box-containing protein
MKSLIVAQVKFIQPCLFRFVLAILIAAHGIKESAYCNSVPDEGSYYLSETEAQSSDSVLIAGEFAGQQDTFAEGGSANPAQELTADDSNKNAMIPASPSVDSNAVSLSRSEEYYIIPFYRKWWFSLLVVMLAIPFLYRYLTKREKKRDEERKAYEASVNRYNQLLTEKDEQLEKQESEFHLKMVEEEELKFHAMGLSKFSELMSNNKDGLEKLGQQLMHELVKYLGVNMGAIYTARGEEISEMVLELLGAFAPDAQQMQTKIHPGEGYIGTCYNEGLLMEITDVPKTYTKISSGLGEAVPRYIAFIPLVQDDVKLGVMELASFKKLEKYKLDFVQKLSQNIASHIAIRTSTARMKEMLEQSRSQAEELQSQEEELRQNLEEMQATQEELNRQIGKNKLVQEDLAKEKYLMDALMNSIPEYIYFKDTDSKFLKNSLSHTILFGFSDPTEILGKSDLDFFSEEHAMPAFEAEQKIIKTGKPIIDLVEKEVKKDGTVSWVSTTKMPLLNQQGKVVGTFGISKDITESKKIEMEVQEKNEALQAQEEELRQNLEEMQTVQEELQRQKVEMAKEKALMDALLGNVKETIYFKDEKSRFIKVSDSMARLFNVKSVEELYGKSDFDFFTEEHARPAFEDEMKIIKTGRPIINKIEKETYADGRISWVSTSKMPLYNTKGKIIGTFGITKDITETKKFETEAKEKTEELLAQEEELKQNLEEMHTIQEDLQRRILEGEKMEKEFRKKEVSLMKTIETLEKRLAGKG